MYKSRLTAIEARLNYDLGERQRRAGGETGGRLREGVETNCFGCERERKITAWGSGCERERRGKRTAWGSGRRLLEDVETNCYGERQLRDGVETKREKKSLIQ